MGKIIKSSNGKQIKEIKQQGGYDSRYDDIVIMFEDGSSILIQGDFSITSLEKGQKSNEPEFYSANPVEPENGMPKGVIASVKNCK